MENDVPNNSAVGLAFVQGAIVGAIGALLFAPRSGRELRQQLRDYSRQTGERVRDMAEKSSQGLERAMEKGRDLVDKGRSIAEEAGTAYQGAAGSARQGRRLASGVESDM